MARFQYIVFLVALAPFVPVLIWGFLNARRKAKLHGDLMALLGLARGPDGFDWSGPFRGIPAAVEAEGVRTLRGRKHSEVVRYLARPAAPLGTVVILDRDVYPHEVEYLKPREDLDRLQEFATGDRRFDSVFRTLAADPESASLLGSVELRAALLNLRFDGSGLCLVELGAAVHVLVGPTDSTKFWTYPSVAQPMEMAARLASAT
jgi:hypothetical protein